MPRKNEVIICDDGCDPPIAGELDLGKWPFVATVLRQEKRGPAAARNTAISHARGAVLLFLDDDAVPGDHCLSKHLSAQLQASGNTAVMGGFGLSEDNRRDSLALLVDQSSVLFPHAMLEAGRMYSTDCFRTTNCSIPKALVESVGGFDETFSLPSAEDAELGRRLKRASIQPFFSTLTSNVFMMIHPPSMIWRGGNRTWAGPLPTWHGDTTITP